MCFCYINNSVVCDYNFKILKIVKTVIDDYDFRFKVKTVFDNYYFKNFLND